ncbi:DUF2851 family protein [Actomonas aquatica]|uniref:DUF2851 family protein n=1 Tax=Actomonas aquatica TaxID=2866162 RepID=A0ABZ1C7W0_9BACT|nr:DUF2851 family protein [Opitutus sp. WL0086]WRQ87794.1 DUF2851 family protein [Opitutus sp. WL0086]
MSADDATQVMELQGLYGPFQFPELLLQRIWAERAFCVSDGRTANGEAVRIDTVGRWNRQGGPDFKGARVCVGGQWLHGDVELHLREEDWRHHRHAADPAYNEVVLHVVLFPPEVGTTTRGAQGAIPVLPLLPLLWHDLEEYASDAAVSAIAARPADRLAEDWLELDEEARAERVEREARRRWTAKMRYARLRVERLGWESACHHTALEILGYRFNRAPMLEVASRWPLGEWRGGAVDPEAAYEALSGRWSLQGVRPANHPRKRLAAYARWIGEGTEAWPRVLARMAEAWPAATQVGDIREWRREAGWSDWRASVMKAIGAAEVVPRPRADNLWGDGLLPLLAARGGEAGEASYFPWWFGAWPGDQPGAIVKAARLIGLADGGRRHPLAWGHVQALLGWQHARDAEALSASGRRT